MSDRLFNCILDTRPEKTWPCVIEKTDFKQVLKFFRLIDDPEIKHEEKYYYMVKIFFKAPPRDDAENVTRKVVAFILGKDPETEKEGGEDHEGSAKKVFCWNQDHGRVLAAFWQTYHIDLRKAKMHWWVFNELFQNLPDTTRLMQTIELRGRKPDTKASAESKRALAKAQRAVALDVAEEEKESELDSFFNAMIRGRK